ncbi:adenylyl-sulfate kinase [Desulfoplanes formicivorans]|uniref:Adenylylsulfate kinase n=1 Tax=Desulfoplanes formicivorans TaxID=1592317 RepID=A0A194AKC6_9BACT|nr:adenylyl-sulfate kinase [Desulfoplanes formicivorans]GAU09768.1 adenylylsulfate kinase [Desulfoplanes formicivorans]
MAERVDTDDRGWALWFVGLPGSGKSSVARGVAEVLWARGKDVVHLQMDERRKVYFPEPTYSPRERARAYEMFVDEGALLAGSGRGVIMDGTAPKVAMRTRARNKIARFAEVYVACPLEVAMQREKNRPQGLVMAGLYAKALERKKNGTQFPGLGQVIGVDIPFEVDEHAECVVDNVSLTLEQAVARVITWFDGWQHEQAARSSRDRY